MRSILHVLRDNLIIYGPFVGESLVPKKGLGCRAECFLTVVLQPSHFCSITPVWSVRKPSNGNPHQGFIESGKETLAKHQGLESEVASSGREKSPHYFSFINKTHSLPRFCCRHSGRWSFGTLSHCMNGQKTRYLAAAEFWNLPCSCDVCHHWM